MTTPTTSSKTILELLRKLFQAVKAFRMYGGDHPQTQEYLKAFEAGVGFFLSTEPHMTLVFQGNALLVQETLQPARDPAIMFLTESMSARSITSLEFDSGVTSEEILQVARVLALKPEEVTQGNDVKESIQQQFKKVSFNKIHYVAVNKATEVVAVSEAAGAALQEKTLSRTIEGLTKALERAGFPSESDPPAGSGQPGTEHAGEHPGGRPQLPKATPDLIDFIANKIVPGMTTAWEQMAQVLAEMTKSVRIKLDSAGRAALPAAIVAKQLESGFEPDVVQKTFRELAPDRSDALVLFDSLARALQDSGRAFPAESMEKLFGFLPQIDDMEKPLKGRVLIVESDPDRCAAIRAGLGELSFEVESVASAKEGIDKISSPKSFDVIVLQLDLPDKRGTVVLTHLQASAAVIPAVIIGQKASVDAGEFEVFSYPKKKIIQSFDAKVIAEAVVECARHGGPISDEARKADLEHAREIQGKLIPVQIPRIAGWEMEFLHEQAQDAGGDLIDVFQIDSERVGIILGEVSGRGTDAAALMVMVRSTFRLSVSHHASPLELLARVNRLVCPDRRRGITVALVYACLHIPTGRVSLVHCGQKPPVHYSSRDGSIHIPQGDSLPMGLVTVEQFENALKLDTLDVGPGGQLLFYTRGVTETLNELTEPFYEERILQGVRRDGGRSARDLLKGIETEISIHRGFAAPSRSNDITLLAVRRNPPLKIALKT